MKTQLIKIQDDFILVSDEEIKEGDFIGYSTLKVFVPVQYLGGDLTKTERKIIAGIPELPLIDFSALSEEELKIIGWVDVEKLAKEKYQYVSENPPHVIITPENKLEGFIEGFKAAQSLNDKTFSLEDMFACFNLGIEFCEDEVHKFRKKEFNKFIQSLQQTSWDVEVEMEDIGGYRQDSMNGCWISKWQPKITNSSLKVTKII